MPADHRIKTMKLSELPTNRQVLTNDLRSQAFRWRWVLSWPRRKLSILRLRSKRHATGCG